MTSCLLALILLGFSRSSLSETISTLHVTNAEREVDISTQIVRETIKYDVENAADSSVSYFLQAVEKSKASHVALVQATFTQSGKTSQCEQVAVSAGSEKLVYYKVQLPEPLASKKSLKFSITVSYTHLLQPFPTHILQKDQQFVKYDGNQYINSAYLIKKQSTIYKLSAGTIETYTKLPTAKQDGSKLTYGPYNNVEAHSYAPVTIHYENNSPFLSATQMTRLIEVSHWGNIAVEESISLSHTGAILKGSFSRFDFQRDPRSNDKQPCVKSFKTFLPASAKDVYYRDEIGNISTSNLKHRSDIAELEIMPRFPLFGGWKTNYIIGYNVPSYEYLYTSGNKFALKMRFVDHIFKNYVVDEILLKVILPEGAKDIEFVTPFPVKRLPNEVHYTYLDFTGRPVLVASKKNLIEEHIKEFEIHYTFDRINMIYEPILIVLVFMILFLVAIVYVRLDFTITDNGDTKAKTISSVEQKPEPSSTARKSGKKQQ